MCQRISQTENVRAIVFNVSCPNVKEGGISFGTDLQVVKQLTQQCKAVTHLPIYVKLTSNVTDIVSIAKAAEEGGADAITMINTITGMAFNLESRQNIN